MATLSEQLIEAEAAYHALMTGASVVEVRDSNGEHVRFTAVNAGRLRNYIVDLKSKIAAEGTSGTVPTYPMRFQF